MLDVNVVSAIFRKDMRTYLGNPTGYVFITLFIFATSAAMVLQEEFFSRNLADLATLNEWMPRILLFFVSAITMNAWADERRAGTDELLLTLPVRDGEVVLGKYLGVLGMFTLSLAIAALGQLGGLSVVGDPDKGLMFSTFVGYWLIGALFTSVGLAGSMLTLNTTVAFIYGALGCVGLVYADSMPWTSGLLGMAVLGLLAALVAYAIKGSSSVAVAAGLSGATVGAFLWQSRNLAEAGDAAAEGAATLSADAAPDLSTRFEEIFASLSVDAHFTSFGEGVIRLGDVLFFVSGAVLMLYLCTFLLGRRHW